MVSDAQKLINKAKESGCKLLFPIDSIVANAFDSDAEIKICDVDSTPGILIILINALKLVI